MEGMIVMSRKEGRRIKVLEQVINKKITLNAATDFLEVCYRQAKRMKRRYEDMGVAGLVHGNRGRTPSNAMSKNIRDEIVKLYQRTYFDSNDTHFTELISEREDIELGRETVRKILRGAGIKPKRKRRPPRHHSRRLRRDQRGMMVQWDGSPHHWFGEDRLPCCLMNAVDDATGEVLGMLFVPSESSAAYLRLLDMILRRHGAPFSIYHDRHSSLVRNDDHWSLEEQLQGSQYPTHVGFVLQQIGIVSIPANSAQAKGRVERPFGVLQDRLIVELRLAGIKDIESANKWLVDHYIERYNKRFSIKPAKSESSFREISKKDIYELVTFCYESVVGNDNCVRLGGLVIDIPPGETGRGFAKNKVLVKQHIDGAWSVLHKGKKIVNHPPTAFREPVRQWKRRENKHHRRTISAKEIMQVYIASKPATPPRGHFPLAVRGTY